MSKVMQATTLLVRCERPYCENNIIYVGTIPYGINEREVFEFIKIELGLWQWKRRAENLIFCSSYCEDEHMGTTDAT